MNVRDFSSFFFYRRIYERYERIVNFYFSDKQPQQKKFKFSFESCDGPKTDENSIDRHDLMAFLGKPCPDNCDDLDQIKYYPCIQKLFMRFNSIPCSSSPLSTQSISFLGKMEILYGNEFQLVLNGFSFIYF